MSSILIVCLTAVLVFSIYAALSVWHAKHDAEREDLKDKRVRAFGAEVSALTLRLNDALEALEQRETGAADQTRYVCDRVEAASQDTSKALLALSERQVVLENAIKNAIAQLVQVSGFSEEKYKQLVAASVRGSGRPASTRS